ncbi:TonB-dependent receptor [Aquimarina sp. ERC-38]|uniref:TonB-dependent receptor domain-containing protein n=1 Tax=Aquimarina sp. ERC-38 TaxID=2949996 RepID=UPI0022455E56|nr:TonB-dependent receptor [Aquimarina sp. ERC-38]UZO80078.1 TonB-dependent receptor [Aquimarina sp. ERC-38]
MHYLPFCFIILLQSFLYGQTSTLSGKIMVAGTTEPLPFTNITLKTKESTILSGTITDDKGNFRISDIAVGSYILDIEFIGFVPQQIDIKVESKKNYDLGIKYLTEQTEILESVTITAQKSTVEQRLDRKIVTVGKDLVALGPSAADLMNNLPAVSVNSDGNISFRGSDNVRILIDGKLSNLENPADILQQIPSNTIKKIELISNPSAKYSPDGLNGMINIILKKTAKKGWNTALSTNLTIAQKEQYNSNISINFKPGKTNYYLNYSNGYGDQVTDGVVNRFDLNSSQVTRNLNNRRSNVVRIGADFTPTSQTTLSIFTNQNFYNALFDGEKQVLFTEESQNNFALNDILTRDNYTQVYNTDYKWSIDGNLHFLELEANYNRFESDAKNDFRFSGATTVPSYLENIDDQRSVFTLNLDYKVPLSKKSTLEIGGESRINKITNTYIVTNAQLENSQLQYDRDIYSSYLMYTAYPGRFEINVGSRFEYYLVNARFDAERSDKELFSQKLFSVFPSVFIGYQPSPESVHQYQISYGRRIERPSFNQVNPIRQTTTPQILATGNLGLTPQFSNILEASHLYRLGIGTISSGVFYRFVKDEINRIGIFDQEDPNLLRLSYDNFERNQAYGAEISSNLKLTSWWRTNTSVEFYTRQQEGAIEGEKVSVRNTLTNLKWTNNFTLFKQVSASLFAFYSGPQDVLQYRLKFNYYINAGLRYNFVNGKGSISLNANDILGTRRFAFKTFRTVFQEGEFLRDTQQVFIGLSYRFGGKLSSLSRKKRKSNIKADRFL